MESNSKAAAEKVNNLSINCMNENDKQNYIEPIIFKKLLESDGDITSSNLEAIETSLSPTQTYDDEINIRTETTLQRDTSYNTIMCHVFKYLLLNDHLTMAKVCKSWYNLLKNNVFWKSISLKGIAITNWSIFIDLINNKGTTNLDTTLMEVPKGVGQYQLFWFDFIKAIIRTKNLKVITLYNCPTTVIEDVMINLTQLEVLNVHPGEFQNYHIDLNYLVNMPGLRALKIRGFSGNNMTKVLPLSNFESLIHLKSLSLTHVIMFPDSGYHSLSTITTGLQVLEIEHTNCFDSNIINALPRFINLTKLRLKNSISMDPGNLSYIQVFRKIRRLEKIKRLDLLHFSINDIILRELKYCKRMKFVLITPFVCNIPKVPLDIIDNIFKCVDYLFNTSTREVWGIVVMINVFIDDKFQHYNYTSSGQTESITRSSSIIEMNENNTNPNLYNYNADAQHDYTVEIRNPKVKEQPSPNRRYNRMSMQMRFAIHYMP